MSSSAVNMRRIIADKKRGGVLPPSDVRPFVEGIASGAIDGEQLAAWLMAVFFRGLGARELTDLTRAMCSSGAHHDFSRLPGVNREQCRGLIDKHSTGGVGDKVSFLFAPLAVCLGYKVPMVAGRTLGHTGGTIDKLEAIPGFRTDIEDTDSLEALLRGPGMFIVGQSPGLCPADRRLYALRDVTETVDQIDLICASIVSKKLAEGTQCVVYDVKCGSGGFMPEANQARELAIALVGLSRSLGLKAAALVTDMSFPLGRMVGNGAELLEVLEILSGEYPHEDARELGKPLYALTVALLHAAVAEAGGSMSHAEVRSRCDAAIADGEALRVFMNWCLAQGARDGFIDTLRPPSLRRHVVKAGRGGVLRGIDAGAVGHAGLLLRMGRMRLDDAVSHGHFIEMLQPRGREVAAGEALLAVEVSPSLPDSAVDSALKLLAEAVDIGDEPAVSAPAPDLVLMNCSS